MVLDVLINRDSFPVEISDPFHPDMDAIIGKIESFAASRGINISGLDVRGLIPEMIRGIAGCEHGCPSNAKDLVSKGYRGFELQYIEGGILSARSAVGNDTFFYLKMFPDF